MKNAARRSRSNSRARSGKGHGFERLEPRLTLSASSPLGHFDSALRDLRPVGAAFAENYRFDQHAVPGESVSLLHRDEHERPTDFDRDDLAMAASLAPIRLLVVYQPPAPLSVPTSVVTNTVVNTSTGRPLAATSPIVSSPPTSPIAASASSDADATPTSQLTPAFGPVQPLLFFSSLQEQSSAADLPSSSVAEERTSSVAATSVLVDRAVDAADDEALDAAFAEFDKRGERDEATTIELTLSDDMLDVLQRWQREQISLDNTLNRLEDLPAEKQEPGPAQVHEPPSQPRHDDHPPRPASRASFGLGQRAADRSLVAGMVLLQANGDPNSAGGDLPTWTSEADLPIEQAWPVGIYQCIEVGGYTEPVEMQVVPANRVGKQETSEGKSDAAANEA